MRCQILVALALLGLMFDFSSLPAQDKPPVDRDPTKAPPAPRVGRIVRTFKGHEGGVHGVAFLPDGKHILTGSGGLGGGGDSYRAYDCTLRLWDVSTGKEVLRSKEVPSPIWSIALSPNGDHALTSCGDTLIYRRPFDCVLRLFDVKTGKELRQFVGHKEPVWSTAFSADGSRVLSGAGNYENTNQLGPRDCTVRLWDARTGKQLQCMHGHENRVYGVAFLANGKQAVSASADRTLRLWDLEKGKELNRLEGHTNAVHGLAVSPVGHRAATAGWDETVRVWDLDEGEQLFCVKGHKGLVMCVAFSPDGRLLASGGYDNTLRLWDARTGKVLGVMTGHTMQLRSITFSADGKSILSGASDRTAILWDISREEK